MKRLTRSQQNSMYKYERMLAKELNEAGYWVKKTLMRKPEVDLPWTQELIHQVMWLPVLEAMAGKDSSTEMDSVEPSQVHQVISQHILDLTDGNIYLPFPSEESLYPGEDR